MDQTGLPLRALIDVTQEDMIGKWPLVELDSWTIFFLLSVTMLPYSNMYPQTTYYSYYVVTTYTMDEQD
jgi:hypothetical protein